MCTAACYARPVTPGELYVAATAALLEHGDAEQGGCGSPSDAASVEPLRSRNMEPPTRSKAPPHQVWGWCGAGSVRINLQLTAASASTVEPAPAPSFQAACLLLVGECSVLLPSAVSGGRCMQ